MGAIKNQMILDEELDNDDAMDFCNYPSDVPAAKSGLYGWGSLELRGRRGFKEIGRQMLSRLSLLSLFKRD